MTDATCIEGDLFDGGPPMRLQRTLGLVRPGQRRVTRRAFLAVLIAWVPPASLAIVQILTLTSETGRSFFSDFGVHARYLIAVPALIFAEADCTPRLGRIVRHFLDAGLVCGADVVRYERAVASTRRLLDSTVGDVVAATLAYAVAITLMIYVAPETWPEWHRGEPEGSFNLSAAGGWHMLVSLPLLLILFFGWFWRLVLWGRFLFLMARLDLRLIPSHPDHAAGLGFLSSTLRGFRLISMAMGAIVAGAIANRVVHHGQHLMGFRGSVITLTIVILVISAGPLSIFLRRLQETKRRGMFEYGALAGFLGTQFENKWLPGRGNLEPDSLESTNFSATTDLFAIVTNVYEMRGFPFGLKDLIDPVFAGLIPILPVALLAVPVQVIVDGLAKLLF